MNDKIKIEFDITKSPFVVDTKCSPQMLSFLKEEKSTFGNWEDTLYEAKEPGWYKIYLETYEDRDEFEVNVHLIKIIEEELI